MISQRLPKSLACLLFKDEQTGLWISHCLNFDLVTSGTTEDDAWEGMKIVVKAHVESCFADGWEEGLSKKADPSVWSAFFEQAFAGIVRSALIEFSLKEKDTSGMWLKGVGIDSSSAHTFAAS